MSATRPRRTRDAPSPKAASSMQPETLALILAGDAKKGDVLGTARIAGIMAAKKTHELIPLCHPLLLTKVVGRHRAGRRAARPARHRDWRASPGKTGVEMEALTAASVACLTIYDMAKAVDRGMVIAGIRLVEKTGGKSGDLPGGMTEWRCFRSTRRSRACSTAPSRSAPKTVPLAEAAGRVLAEPLVALRTQPPFDASAMDGYAVRAADVASVPATLARDRRSARPAGASPARSAPARRCASSPARRCPTAPTRSHPGRTPRGRRRRRRGRSRPSRAGRHIRRAGLDFARGRRAARQRAACSTPAALVARRRGQPCRRCRSSRRPLVAHPRDRRRTGAARRARSGPTRSSPPTPSASRRSRSRRRRRARPRHRAGRRDAIAARVARRDRRRRRRPRHARRRLGRRPRPRPGGC